MRLKGKNALITGASSGIGRAIAIRFAQEGANVAINHYHDADGAAETARQIQTKHFAIDANVADPAQVKAMMAQAVDRMGSVDILVNNAGILKQATAAHETSIEDFDAVMDVNLRGAFLCCREAIAHFLARGGGGVIVNNTSVHQLIPKPKYLPYSISKGGLDNLTRSLALEYAGRGIRVNSVGPGAVVTPMNNAWIHDAPAREIVESHIPLGRAAEPEEIAAVFAFLASSDASYITGQTLYACGGLTLYPEFRVAWASGE